MDYPLQHRPRILRKSAVIRDLVQETRLGLQDFLVPLFLLEGLDRKEEISSMPQYFRFSLDGLLEEINTYREQGIKSFLLFSKCEDHLKDSEGTESYNPDGLMQRGITAIKKNFPDVCLFTDIALDPYSSFGHDGLVRGEEIVNDETVEVLKKMAVSHAAAGADFVAPSDMMDGRIGGIRNALELAGFHQTGILAYSAKYASSFYGPFRNALDSAPGFGDKKTYQMNVGNRLEALKEVELDVLEGADIVMVKPALSYLDIIREVKNNFKIPVSAYHVSGEYSMIKAASQRGWIDEDAAILEATLSIKRAGADLIATYFTKDLIRILNQQ
jgi:porphobilinogen synthase